MNDKIESDEAIRQAITELGGRGTDADIDFVKTYTMEQEERAQELYEAAVGDGVNFAVAVDDEVFINSKWFGNIVQTMMEAILLGGEVETMTTVEVLGQTIIAADKFVGKS